ncbi:MAG: hypothetical protein NBV67_18690, partial [Tagaea sp.]|nr:hypothetical protein [Tagaea sp.]
WEPRDPAAQAPAQSDIRDMAWRPERDGEAQPMPLPDRIRTPEEEARDIVPISYDTRAGTQAPVHDDGMLDPAKWPEHLRAQGQAAEDEADEGIEDVEIESAATATDYADDDPEALLAAQAQPQPGQQARPQQNQNPPRQGQDRIPQPPRLAPRRDGDPQAQLPQQPDSQQAHDQQPEQYPPPPRPRPPRRGEAPPHPLDRVGEWETRPDLIPPPGFSGQSWSAARASFRQNVAIAENNNTTPSLSMRHEAARDGGGREVVLGQYQIKDSTLQEVGLKNRDGTWAPGQLHGTVDGVRREIRSNEDFLKSTDAQDAALSRVLQSYRVQAERRGLDQHIGQRLEGVRFPVLITESGLAAASHRAGVGAVNQYVDRLQRNGWDSDRARRGLDDRQKRLHDAIETRLRLFANERLFD